MYEVSQKIEDNYLIFSKWGNSRSIQHLSLSVYAQFIKYRRTGPCDHWFGDSHYSGQFGIRGCMYV